MENEELWHFKRICEFCGYIWSGLYCPHDNIQNPCDCCGKRPIPKQKEKCDCEFDY